MSYAISLRTICHCAIAVGAAERNGHALAAHTGPVSCSLAVQDGLYLPATPLPQSGIVTVCALPALAALSLYWNSPSQTGPA